MRGKPEPKKGANRREQTYETEEDEFINATTFKIINLIQKEETARERYFVNLPIFGVAYHVISSSRLFFLC